MADWNTAYNFMMDNEDLKRAYAIVPDAPEQLDPVTKERIGAFAIAGINSAAFPGEYACIAATAQQYRAKLVERFYRTHFWNQWFDQLASDDIAKRVFDMAVNGGAGTAVRLLQCAILDLSGIDGIDGQWGPMTVTRANWLDADKLVSAFQRRRVARYREIVAKNPADARYLPQWIARAER
jgi:lysozyme family protein